MNSLSSQDGLEKSTRISYFELLLLIRLWLLINVSRSGPPFGMQKDTMMQEIRAIPMILKYFFIVFMIVR